jgi:hypothetical protein
VFRCDWNLLLTNKSTGGGVMVCARRSLYATVYHEWSCSGFESLCVIIPARALGTSAELIAAVAYLPPDEDNLPCYLDSIKSNVSRLLVKNPICNYLLLGDYNLSCISWSSVLGFGLKNQGKTDFQNAAIAFVDELQYLGLTQHNFIMNSCHNVLDLCFSNLPLSVKQCQPISKLDLYHPSFNIDILDLYNKPLKNNRSLRFNFYKCDYSKINMYLKEIDWENLLNIGDINKAIDIFYNRLNECFSLFVPILQSKNESYPIWYSSALIKILREKAKLHRRWKKYLNPRDYDEFSLLRARQKRVQDECFHRFTQNTETYIKRSPKIFWKYVKSKRGGSNYPNSFQLGSSQYSGGKEICDAFNSFFESVFATASSSSNLLVNPHPINQSDVLSSVIITSDTVLKYLKSLDISKGPGCDGVPPVFLSSCAESLASPLAIIFQNSLKCCIFPSIWKKAHIIPIHKKGSKSKIDNYRPISILNTMGKLFESIIFTHIYPVVCRGISDRQHGFLKSRSTVSNLSYFTNFVITEMEGGGQVDVIYTDFEKAFDRVDHAILLLKLQVLGIHGDLLRWVESYLINRSQAVVLGGYKSDYIEITSGVPQGSHLGPLFYNAYIFDIANCINNANYLLYADDKKVFMCIKSEADCELLQSDLNNLLKYYSQNNITLSINKCQCISFTRKTNPLKFLYNFNGVVVQRVDVVRDLGVTLDAKMTMRNHVDLIVNKAYRNLGFVIRTCKPFRNLLSMKIVYFAYVRSVLEYASPVWSVNYAVHKNRIENIQKKFVKHLNFKFDHSSSTYRDNCHKYNLLTLEDRRKLTDMSLLFDIIDNRLDCPELLSSLLFRVPKRRTRKTTLFQVPLHSTNYGANAVLSRIPHLYNQEFDTTDPFSGSKTKFKNEVCAVLLNKQV